MPSSRSNTVLSSVGMGDICAEAVAAATEVLKKYGINRPAVVLNVAWREDGMEYAIGSKVPNRYRALMADSLEASSEEARTR